ncbi:MAG: biotin/lipoyl-containing protein, partial [Selenomonas artemidis]
EITIPANEPGSSIMPGKIIDVKVSVGQAVKAGDTLLILEAMKMQNEIPAVSDGTVSAISVSAGQSVKAGDPLVTVG